MRHADNRPVRGAPQPFDRAPLAGDRRAVEIHEGDLRGRSGAEPAGDTLGGREASVEERETADRFPGNGDRTGLHVDAGERKADERSLRAGRARLLRQPRT